MAGMLFLDFPPCYNHNSLLNTYTCMAKKKKEEARKRRTHTFLSLFHVHLSDDTKRALVVIGLLVCVALSVMSLLHAAGIVGEYWAEFLFILFGFFGYVAPVGFLVLALLLGWPKASTLSDIGWGKRTVIGLVLCSIAFTGLWHGAGVRLAEQPSLQLALSGRGAGLLGWLVATPFYSLLGFWAGTLVLAALLVSGALILFNVPLFIKRAAESQAVSNVKTVTPVPVKINSPESVDFVQESVETSAAVLKSPVKPVPAVNAHKPVGDAKLPDAVVLEERKDWKLPPFDLLDDHKTSVDSGNIEANIAIIHKTLADFGIEVEMGEVNVGPTVTQYTLRPNTGVKLSQIAGLKSDLALALAAHAIRMELPIPGKALVGIEVPNKSSRIVSLREVLQTSDFINHPSRLVFALGRDVAGKAQITDIAKMPHLLIAGSTGTGKSVALNSLIISLLYRNTPQDVKLIMVDPKRVEMTLYNGIPHLLTPPIVEPDKAVNALKWAVSEMDRRYKLLAEAQKRNIAEYNSVAPLALSYIVIVVDELADLMAVAQADIEAAIVRLAQMARAVGIHLVLATQRPSVDIITGLIKANITSRVAFAVASQIDSRTILDASGAEQLLGNGDMLFVSAESNKPRRIQGAYIGEKEVRKVTDFFKQQAGAVIYSDDVTQKPKAHFSIPGFEGGGDGEDDLLETAQQEVLRAGKASASFLQRRLKVGYARAARLLDLLEERGVVGPGEGAKPREVYGVQPGAGDQDEEEFGEGHDRFN